MKAAVELEIFTAIAEGNTAAATIAKRSEAAERGVRTLCDFLTIHGFLTKEETQYALAPDSALFLDRHSPAYIGGAIEFLLTPRLREGHARLAEAVRRGGTALGEGALEPENPDWVKFAQAMMPLMHMPAEIMAAERRKGGEAAGSRKEECAGNGSCRSLPPASRQRIRNRFWQRLRSGVDRHRHHSRGIARSRESSAVSGQDM
jgi:hypothetical protein